tara:strand:- start:347 stop:913 length:567 start_codon:yes stop_codon:yes gene_type:complete
MAITLSGSTLSMGGADLTCSSGAWTSAPTGSVIQVVQNTTQTRTGYNSSGSFSEIAPLGTTITTKMASSKILLQLSMGGHNDNASGDMGFRAARSVGGSVTYIDISTDLKGSSTAGFYPNSRGDDVNQGMRINYIFMDEPAQAAGTAIEYQIYIQTESNNWQLNAPNQDSDDRFCTTRSHVILTEIAP